MVIAVSAERSERVCSISTLNAMSDASSYRQEVESVASPEPRSDTGGVHAISRFLQATADASEISWLVEHRILIVP
jgi:hypothetical protein